MRCAFVVLLLLGISGAVLGQVDPQSLLGRPVSVPGSSGSSPITPLINRPFRPANRPVASAILNRVNGQVSPSANPVNSGSGPGQVNPVPNQSNPSTVQNNPSTSQPNPSTDQGNPTSNQGTSEPKPKAEQILGRLITEFGQEMSETIYDAGDRDTVLFSPLSIATLLTLLMAGMGKPSTTYTEIDELLRYNKANEDFIHQLYQNLLIDLSRNNGEVVFSIGNRLFLQRDNSSQILGSFTKTASEYYGAGVENLDFSGNPTGAANRINQWVNTNTEGKIPKLLTQPLNPRTRFMGVNTVYFKAPWASPFGSGGNIIKSFDTGRGKIDMTFMMQIMSVKYHELVSQAVNATMIELPYKSDRYSMFIIKPKGPASLNSVLDIEYAINSIDSMVQTTQSKNKVPVSVQIPRMRLRYRTYLKEILEKMGASSMFSFSTADFSRITTNNQPILDNMIHEAVMDITEEGTEAAAATSTTHNRFGTNVRFILDQPSLMFIYDSQTKTPIFWARLVTPESI